MTAQRPRIERLAAGTILNATQSTKRALKGAIEETVDQSVAEASRRERDGRVRKAEMMVGLVMLSRGMATKASAAIFASRQHARKESVRRVVAELAAAGIVLSAGQLWGGTLPLLVAAHQTRAADDTAHAQMAGESLAIAWRGMAFYALTSSARKETGAAKALAMTSRPMLKRVERTAECETVQAYADEHKQAIVDAIGWDGELEAQLRDQRIVRRWSSFLEACPVCAEHDGEEVGIGESFDGGDEPGTVHIRCRCYECLMQSAESMRLAS